MKSQPDEVVDIARELIYKYKHHKSFKILDLKSAIMAPPRAPTPQEVEKILSDWKHQIHTAQLHDKNFQVPDDLKVTLLHRIMQKSFHEIMRARQEGMEDMGRPYSQDCHRFEQDLFDTKEIRRMDEENSQTRGVHGLASAEQTCDAPAREYDETYEVFWDDSGIPWVMALEKKVDDAGDEDDKGQGEPTVKKSKGPGKEDQRVLVPKVLVGTVEGLIFSVIALTSMMKRRLGQHLELGDRGDQDHFPDQQYNNGTRGSQSQPMAKVKESQEKEARAKVEKAKGLGPKLVCGIHILDGKAHLWDTFSQIGAPTRTWFPFAAFPRHFPWKPVRGPRNCTTGEQLGATFMEKAPKAWTRPISISNRFHVLSAHDDDAYFPELGIDTCTDRPRMPPLPKRLPQQVRKKRFLCPLEKNTQSETDFINKANDMRAQCRAEILATEASRDAHQVKMLTSDRPIFGTSSRHHTPWQPLPGWQLLSLTVDSGASETVIPDDQIRGYEIRETSSTKGMNFVSASGDPIPNLGEQVLPTLTERDTLRTTKFNSCPVTKALGSVKRMCDAGHRLVFDSECSYVYNKHTGETNLMREDQDNYVLDMWVPSPEALRGQVCCEGFPGQR